MREMSYTLALREAIAEEMTRDDRVFLMGEDIAAYGGAFGVTWELVEQFGPERVLNTPISEPGFVGAAIGAAMTGTRPVVEIMFMDFMGLAADQLVNQAAKLHYIFGDQLCCPLVVRTATGGGRCYGATHSQTLEAWFIHTPGIKIAAPSSPADAKGLLKTAIRDDNPVLFLEHKMLYGLKGLVPDGEACVVPFGQANTVLAGDDLTIIAWSWMVQEARAAAAELADAGISAEVIDLRTLVPLDIDTLIESAQKTGRVMVVQEGCRTGGVAAEIACQLHEYLHDCLAAPVMRVTSPDIPVPASPVLEAAMLPNRDRIVQAAFELMDAAD